MLAKIRFSNLPASVLQTGVKKDTFIIGIGHNSEVHLGLMLQMVENQKKGVDLLTASFIVVQIGNASSLEKYRLSGETITVDKLKEKDKTLFAAQNFSVLKTVINCNLRFRNGLNVMILEGENKGTSSQIHSIQKFPDAEAPLGCALYNITFEDDITNKIYSQLDDNLQLIQFNLKNKD